MYHLITPFLQPSNLADDLPNKPIPEDPPKTDEPVKPGRRSTMEPQKEIDVSVDINTLLNHKVYCRCFCCCCSCCFIVVFYILMGTSGCFYSREV